jgi:peptide/nickel transport system permease protein
MAVREQPLPQIGLGRQERSAGSRFAGWLLKFARQQPLGFISGILSLFALIVAIGAWQGVFVPYDPIRFHGADRLVGPLTTSADGSRFYVLGTDQLGRDMLSRLIKGAQLSLFFAIGVSVLSVIVGGVVGLFSAYVGGKVDLVIQRVVDAVQTVPFLVLAIAIVSVLGPGIWQGFWAVALLSIPRPARVIRGSVLSAKENMWVEAARSTGCSDNRIMFRHILPNVTAPMIVLITYILAVAIIIEASLSFLGIGAQPPTPSWGAMLSGEGRGFTLTSGDG